MKIEDLGDWLSTFYLDRTDVLSGPMYAILLYELIKILESEEEVDLPSILPYDIRPYQNMVIDGIMPFITCGQFAAVQIIGEIDDAMIAALAGDFDSSVDELLVECTIDVEDREEDMYGRPNSS